MEKFNVQEYVASMAVDMMRLFAGAIEAGEMPDLPVVVVFDPHGDEEMRAALARCYKLPDTASATMLLVTNDEALREMETQGAVGSAALLRKPREPWMVPVLVARDGRIHTMFACMLPNAPGAKHEIAELARAVEELCHPGTGSGSRRPN